jgi:hypothetical protein
MGGPQLWVQTPTFPSRRTNCPIEEIVPERVREEFASIMGYWPRMAAYQTTVLNNSLKWVASEGRNIDLSDFTTLFGLAVGGRLPCPFFAYGKAYCNEKFISENIYLSTPDVIFFTQKKMPFLWNDDHEWKGFWRVLEEEKKKYAKDWPRLSHFWALASDLRDEGRVPAGWKLVYVRSDADPSWDGDEERSLGICRPDGSISWYENAGILSAALE